MLHKLNALSSTYILNVCNIVLQNKQCNNARYIYLLILFYHQPTMTHRAISYSLLPVKFTEKKKNPRIIKEEVMINKYPFYFIS